MKNRKRYFLHPATLFFLLTVAVALFSWIGSVYGLGTVQSLLSPEGIRWELRHVTGNYMAAPALGIVTVLFLGLGIVSHAGMTEAVGKMAGSGKALTRKEKRAMILALCTILLYSLLVYLSTFAPFTVLRSVTGTLANSPFVQGIYYITSFGIGLSGIVFGYTTGRFRNDRDIIRGMSSLFSRFSDYFVILFFIVQFFSALMYTNLTEWIGIDSLIVRYAFQLCCYLPLLWMLLGEKKHD